MILQKKYNLAVPLKNQRREFTTIPNVIPAFWKKQCGIKFVNPDTDYFNGVLRKFPI